MKDSSAHLSSKHHQCALIQRMPSFDFCAQWAPKSSPPAGLSTLPEQPEQELPFGNPAYQVRVYRRAEQLPLIWDQLAGEQQVFLQRAYLQAFEQSPPDGFSFAYLMITQHGRPIGIASCQLIDFRVADKVQSLRADLSGAPLASQARQWLLRHTLGRAAFRVLLCGAAQATGQHAFAFHPNFERGQQWALLLEALDLLTAHLQPQGQAASVLMIKDLPRTETVPALSSEGFHRFPFQPNMCLKLPPEWCSREDYLAAMSSKYRVRAKRAFKKAVHLERRWLDQANLAHFQPRMHELYQQVADRASFSMMHLPADYFLNMKRAFGEDFRVLAYFEGDCMLGFCSLLRNGDCVEAHFLGFEEQQNQSAQLYLNMLYDVAGSAIEDFGAESVSFARTATEIKSSVGAVPYPADVYIKHRQPLINRFLPLLVDGLSPEEEYTVRHPFK